MTGDVRSFYTAIGVDLPTRGTRNVTLRCFANPEAHKRGDKMKSCSVSLETGAWNCKACGAKGGPYDAALSQGIDKREAAELCKRFSLWQEKEDNVVPLERRRGRKQATSDDVKSDKPTSGGGQEKSAKGDTDGHFALTLEHVEAMKNRLSDSPETIQRVCELRGWTPEAMAELELGLDQGRVSLPLYAADGALVGLLRYQPDPEKRGEKSPKMLAEEFSARELFPTPERAKAGLPEDADEFIFLVEGEPDAIACWSCGIRAVGIPGVQTFDDSWPHRFKGLKVVVCFDCDERGRQAAGDVSVALFKAGVNVRRLDLDRDRDDGYDISDFLSRAKTSAEREAAAELLRKLALQCAPVGIGATGAARELSLSDVFEVFDRWLFMPDETPLLAVLGAYTANHLQGEPVWLLLVGPPGSGKTELLMPLDVLSDTHLVSTLSSEAALLSGSPARDRTSESTGGLLREIGDFGVVNMKDFTSILSMQRDRRQGILAAFREIYDGTWAREIGAEGARKLEWRGKVGFLAGVTPEIDRMHHTMAGLGERFIFLRMPPAPNRFKLLSFILERGGDEGRMRTELGEAIRGLFAHGVPREPLPMDDDDKLYLMALATFVAHARSHVQRDGYTREVEGITPAEVPSRLIKALERLMAGITAVGADRVRARRVAGTIGLGSIPADRLRICEILWNSEGDVTTTEVSEASRLPTTPARRNLEDLALHHVVERESQGQGKADLWRMSRSAWTLYGYITSGAVEKAPIQAILSTFPETSPSGIPSKDSLRAFVREHTQHRDKSGKVPRSRMDTAEESVPDVTEAAENGGTSEPTDGPEAWEAWVRQDGWRQDDAEIADTLRIWHAPDVEITRLVDLAYDVRREKNGG